MSRFDGTSPFPALRPCTTLLLPVLFPVVLALAMSSCSGDRGRYLDVRGPLLGQEPPGDEPALFAPGIVSTMCTDRDLTMTPDGSEIAFLRDTSDGGGCSLLSIKPDGTGLTPLHDFCTAGSEHRPRDTLPTCWATSLTIWC